MMSVRKRRRSARELKKELKTIYTGSDGAVPDMTRLQQNDTSRFRRALIRIICILFGLSVLAWSGFFLFTKGLFQEKETLQVTIETPPEIRSGEETSLTIRYENVGRVPIAALEAKLNLPASFHLISSLPAPTQGTQWTIGSLTARSDGSITIKGIFLSEVPSSQRIQALFTYKPANFSSDFQKIVNKTIPLNASALAITMTGPEKALVGDPVQYTINLQHNGKDPVFNIRVFPVFPADFTLQESKPKLNEQQTAWEIPSLEPGKVLPIVFKGAFTSTASGTLPVKARVGFMSEESFFEQASADVKTDVLGGAISFHLIVDGSDQSQSVNVGKTMHGSIDYKNPGKEPVEDVVFTLTLESNGSIPVELEKGTFTEAKRTGQVIRWNKETKKTLAKIEPGAEGLMDFSLPLVSNLSGFADTFTMKLAVTVGKVGSILTTRTIESTPIVLTLNSNASLSTQARYFSEDGTPLGSGELPPRVGKSTSYRVIWDLTNSLHELTSIQIETTLPQDVTWKDVTSKDIGTISFNSTTRQIRWSIQKLPTEIKEAQATFDLVINPKKQDIGKFMKLTNQTTFQTTDTATKSQITSTGPILTTELPGDEFANAKGTVME